MKNLKDVIGPLEMTNTGLGKSFVEFSDCFSIFIIAEILDSNLLLIVLEVLKNSLAVFFQIYVSEVHFRTEVAYLISFKGQIWDGTVTR